MSISLSSLPRRVSRRSRFAGTLLGSCLLVSSSFASLTLFEAAVGNYGLSIDAAGSNGNPAGTLQAEIPIGATISKAYLYAVGTPYPWYTSSPQTTADYNGAGISVGGVAVTSFDTIVGATSDRTDIGAWYTGRADVTSTIQGLQAANPGVSTYMWDYVEGTSLNNFIDGAVLAIIYEDASLPISTVALLDGGQDTGGETTTVNFTNPLTNVDDPGFFANMSLAISFSIGNSQVSEIDVNGTRLSSAAGGFDDGSGSDGGLITAGGVGDSTDNPINPNSSSSADDELYDLTPFLSNGDTSFSIFTENDSNDDNIFFMGLRVAAEIRDINDRDVGDDPDEPVIPEPASAAWIGFAALGLLFAVRRRR